MPQNNSNPSEDQIPLIQTKDQRLAAFQVAFNAYKLNKDFGIPKAQDFLLKYSDQYIQDILNSEVVISVQCLPLQLRHQPMSDIKVDGEGNIVGGNLKVLKDAVKKKKLVRGIVFHDSKDGTYVKPKSEGKLKHTKKKKK